MPHLILEYSENLEFDVQALFAQLHDELVATGAVNRKGLKSRAIKHTEYLIGDGFEGYKFVHLDMFFREGRSVDLRKELSQRSMRVLEETFGHYFENDYISLSTNLSELRDGLALTRHNIPKGGVKSD